MERCETFQSPLNSRYASIKIQRLFSPKSRIEIWRKLWLYLAESQMELGLIVQGDDKLENLLTRSVIDTLRECVMDGVINDKTFERAEVEEKKTRHDVMAHINILAEDCPQAGPILHLGATSAFVGDNGDLILMKKGITFLLEKIAKCINNLCQFAEKYKDVATLGYTHYQSAQLTTVGKRACLWIQDLLMDHRNLLRIRNEMRLRGVKGATGSQASFLELFTDNTSLKTENVSETIHKLENLISKKCGFSTPPLIICGQTYTRKMDVEIMNGVCSVATSVSKFATDIRLLSHDKELEEPFDELNQIGSSAMPYKRNPMRCERICGLARALSNLSVNASATASSQWLERTLDDSSNRRLIIPQAFLLADACLNLVENVSSGLVVNTKVIAARVKNELPFLTTENLIMNMVRDGGVSRQECHEKLRSLSIIASDRIKKEGLDNNLAELIKNDEYFSPLSEERLTDILQNCEQRLIGRCVEQVNEFIKVEVNPEVLHLYPELLLCGKSDFNLNV